jgi:hypothetical protein
MFRRICHKAVALAVAYAVALNLLVPFLAALASAAQAMPATLIVIRSNTDGETVNVVMAVRTDHARVTARVNGFVTRATQSIQ